MKVYVIVCCDLENTYFGNSVWSTAEKAQAEVDRLNVLCHAIGYLNYGYDAITMDDNSKEITELR